MRNWEAGGTLFEAIAAVALAGLVSAAWTSAIVNQTAALAMIRERAQDLTAARNLLVHAMSGACSPAPPCPGKRSCRMTRTPLDDGVAGAPRLERLEAAISSTKEGVPGVHLATLAYAGGTCG